MELLEKKVNIAEISTNGHFVEKHKRVIDLTNNKEIFFVEGNAILTTKNHQTLSLISNCLIIPQQVYNPYTQLLERAKD